MTSAATPSTATRTRRPGSAALGRAWHAMATRPALLAGVTILAVLLLAGFFLPLPFNPLKPDPAATSLPPGGRHWFGTDDDGFDIFARTVASGRRDLPLALGGTLASLVVGVPLGLLVSAKNRWSEWVMRALDIFQSFPLVIIAIAVVTLTGNHLQNVVLAIMIINVPRFMRLIRSAALTIRESRFIEAAWASGATPVRVLTRHVLPNVTGVTMVQSSLAAAQSLIVIASLSFLSVGVSPPNPSWGLMIQAGAQDMVTGEWWVALFPGLAVLLAVTAFNLIADSLQLSSEDD